MFSFLTQESKKKIIHIYRMRLSVLYLFALIFIGIFSVAFIVPSYMISVSRKSEVDAEFDAIKKSQKLKNITDTESFITEAGIKIDASLANDKKGYISDVISEIVKRKNSDISIATIALSKNSEGISASISGLALTRERLLSFVKNLEASDYFSNVDYPVSSLAKDKNILFTITFQSIL